MNLAAHLCSNRCMEVLLGDSAFVGKFHDLGFNRMQINPTAANNVIVDVNELPTYAANIHRVINSLPGVEWLFQLNNETSPIWTQLQSLGVPSNLSVLYDASCGKGVKIETFPSPLQYPGIPCGYAGGIGPSTISSILTTIDAQIPLEQIVNQKFLWIDMESSLRTIVKESKEGGERDIFDMAKVMNCIDQAVALGMPSLDIK